MDLLKRTYIKTMARWGKLEDYQVYFLITFFEMYDDDKYYTNKEPDWDIETLEYGHSTFQELQDILRIYFEKNVPNSYCLQEMFSLSRYKAICLYFSQLEKRKHPITAMEQDKIVQLPYEYFSLLKCKLDDKYVEQLLEEGVYNKIDYYLSNFTLSNRLEKRLVFLSQKAEYRDLLCKYIKVHMSKGQKVFDFGDAQHAFVNYADKESILMYISFCSIYEQHLLDHSIFELSERSSDGKALLIKYLEKSCIRDNEIFEQMYLKAETQQLKDMLTISNLRLFLFNVECFCEIDFKMERGMSNIEKQLVAQYEEEVKSRNTNISCNEIIKRLRSGHVSPDMAAWCASNVHGVSSLALSAIIRFAQNAHDRIWKKELCRVI